MKKWTSREMLSNGNITAEDLNPEYAQYKSVLNGAIDRTAAPAGHFSRANLTPRAMTKATVYAKKENTDYLDATNTPDGNRSFRCTTFTSYAGSWFPTWTETIQDLQEGWIQIELGGMVWVNPYKSTFAGGLQKNIFFRLSWNNNPIAIAGPVSQGLHNFRLCGGSFNGSNSGVMKLEIRYAPQQSGDVTTVPIYHVFNMNALVIGRWR